MNTIRHLPFALTHHCALTQDDAVDWLPLRSGIRLAHDINNRDTGLWEKNTTSTIADSHKAISHTIEDVP
jgi:hypothetical protein